MSKKVWLYFFVVVLAGGAVTGGKVWFAEKPQPSNSVIPAEEPESIQKELDSDFRQNDKPITLPDKVLLDVPFTAQAPLREWSDPRQQDACEEAAILMAAHWINDEPFTSGQAAKEEILSLSHFQDEHYGFYQDTSAVDTARLFRDYFNYDASVSYDIAVADIKKALAAGSLVIVPVNGRKLNNPYFTPPGPERHMLVLIGYDEETGEFITNDAGIMRGRSYRYPQKTLMSALRDYPSGRHEPLIDMPTAMIIIRLQ